MATLMIGYDLNTPGQDYASLKQSIKSLGRWWHWLDSTWLVVTDMSAKQARDTLISHLDGNDEVLVIDVTGQARYWHGFNDRASAWLHDTYQ